MLESYQSLILPKAKERKSMKNIVLVTNMLYDPVDTIQLPQHIMTRH